MKEKVEEVIDLLDNLWMNFKNCRAHFPAISNTMIVEDNGVRQRGHETTGS